MLETFRFLRNSSTYVHHYAFLSTFLLSPRSSTHTIFMCYFALLLLHLQHQKPYHFIRDTSPTGKKRRIARQLPAHVLLYIQSNLYKYTKQIGITFFVNRNSIHHSNFNIWTVRSDVHLFFFGTRRFCTEVG